jgi:surface antigen
MKCLILVCIASPALAQNVFIPLSASNGVRTDYQPDTGVVSVVANIFKSFESTLSLDDKQTHIMTVMYAMQNLDNGETAVWYNQRAQTAGRVKVILTYPAQGGNCRRTFTEVRVGKEVREWEEVGCKTIDSQFWTFTGR